MKQTYTYIYSLILGLFVLAACSTDAVEGLEKELDTESFVADFNLAIPVHQQLRTRSGLDELSSLKLLVFDENQQFLYSRTAILKSIVAVTDENFYPPSAQKPSQVLTYSVRLLKSEEARTIHFIANYDWSGFKQDYFLQGIDAGQVVGALESKEEVFWQSKTFGQLTHETFTREAIQLLRNQALISLEPATNLTDFELTGYAVYNHYDRGTVAPFGWDESKQEAYFPSQPTEPTIPSEAQFVHQAQLGLQAIGVFEHQNHNKASIYVVFKGRYKGGAETYYKLDLKKKQEHTQGQPQLYSVVRNTHYRIKLSSVSSAGYKTLSEALAQPAGNNIYGSIELGEYPLVSDGSSILEVSKVWEALVHQNQEFKANVHYSKGISQVKLIPSWGADDPYLYPLSQTKLGTHDAQLTVKMKKVPTDRYLDYTIDVVADTGKGYYLTRKIHVLARSPYDFKLKFERASPTDRMNFNLKFTIPKNFNKDLLPFEFEFFIWNGTPQQNMDIVLKGTNVYYKYKITKASDIGKELVFKFRRNTMQHSINGVFSSDYTHELKLHGDNY